MRGEYKRNDRRDDRTAACSHSTLEVSPPPYEVLHEYVAHHVEGNRSEVLAGLHHWPDHVVERLRRHDHVGNHLTIIGSKDGRQEDRLNGHHHC